MEMGHNTKDARYILTGNSIEDLEKGLAEMKRQIAAGITFSVCYGGNKSELEKERDNEYSDDDCNVCEEDTNWDICAEEDCNDCPLINEDEDEEKETEVKEETDKDKMIAEMAEAMEQGIAEGIVAAIKDFLGM